MPDTTIGSPDRTMALAERLARAATWLASHPGIHISHAHTAIGRPVLELVAGYDAPVADRLRRLLGEPADVNCYDQPGGYTALALRWPVLDEVDVMVWLPDATVAADELADPSWPGRTVWQLRPLAVAS